jgi:hypothetical protein
MKIRFLVELAEKASTAYRKRLIVQALRNALMNLSTGVFACFTKDTSFYILTPTYDELSLTNTGYRTTQCFLARGKRKTEKTACRGTQPPKSNVLAYAENAIAGKQTVIYNSSYLMADNTQLLEQIRKVVREETEPIKKQIDGLAGGQNRLGRKIEDVERKVDAAHVFNKKAHDELVGMIAKSNDINGKEQKLLESRIERIEKHLGLPPL